MKRLAIVGIIGIALLTGCSAPSHTGAAVPTATAGPMTELEYFNAVHARAAFADVSIDILRSVGQQTCQVQKLNHNFADTVKANMVGSSISKTDATLEASTAIRAYCPELIGEIPK